MTQTIRTPAGRFGVWIEADRPGSRPYKVSWSKISLSEYLDRIDLDELDDNQANSIKDELRKFSKGFAWQVDTGVETAIFRSEKEARDWGYFQFC